MHGVVQGGHAAIVEAAGGGDVVFDIAVGLLRLEHRRIGLELRIIFREGEEAAEAGGEGAFGFEVFLHALRVACAQARLAAERRLVMSSSKVRSWVMKALAISRTLGMRS